MALPVSYFLGELERRKEARTENFSVTRFVTRHQPKVEKLLTDLCAVADKHEIRTDLLIRCYLNWLFPVDMRHRPVSHLRVCWSTFMEEWLTTERVDTLAASTQLTEEHAEKLLKAWQQLPDEALRQWWRKRFRAAAMPELPRPYYYSRHYADFLGIALIIQQHALDLGLWGTPKELVQRVVRAQAGGLVGIATQITPSYLLTVKGRARQRSYFVKRYGKTGRSASSDVANAVLVATEEWTADPNKKQWLVSPSAYGARTQVSGVQVSVFSE